MKLKPVDLKLVLSFSSQLCQFYLDNRISLGSPYHLSEVIRKDLLHQPLLQHWRVHCHGRGAWLESEEPGRHIEDSNQLGLTVVEESQPLAIQSPNNSFNCDFMWTRKELIEIRLEYSSRGSKMVDTGDNIELLQWCH